MRTEVFVILMALERMNPELSREIDTIRGYITQCEKRANEHFFNCQKLLKEVEKSKAREEKLRQILYKE